MPQNAILLAGRILLSALFILAALSKLSDVAGTAGYFGAVGLPLPSLTVWLVIAIELIGGLAVLLGFLTTPAAYILALFTIGAAFIGHFGQGGDDPTLVLMNQQAFMKNLAIAGGFLVLAVFGPGAYSLDARRPAGRMASLNA